MKTQNIIALILVILIVAFLLINILLNFFKERIDNLYKMLTNAENDMLEKMIRALQSEVDELKKQI